MENEGDSSERWSTTAIAPVAPGMQVSRGAPIVAILVQRRVTDGTERTVLDYADQWGQVWPIGTGERIEMDDVWIAGKPELGPPTMTAAFPRR